LKNINFEFTEIKSFDVEKERNRINQCFEGEIRLKLLKILDLFFEEKFQESLDIINSLEYLEEEERDEKEFVGMFISDTLWEMGSLGVKVKKVVD